MAQFHVDAARLKLRLQPRDPEVVFPQIFAYIQAITSL
jgi:hypothetical protein